MVYSALAVLLSFSSVGDAGNPCAREIGASAVVIHLADLPQDIRDEMHRLKELFGDMADSDIPLLETDAPSSTEKGFAQTRFDQAMLVKNVWFVQFEVAMVSGVRTVSFSQQSDGHFHFNPNHYFGGEGCAAIQAALAGVTTLTPSR